VTTDIRDRLRAALGQPSRRLPAARVESVTELPDLSGLGGHWFESSRGPGYVVESVYEAGHEHGNIPLHRALALDTAQLSAQCRDRRLAQQHPADFLYIDTETTGLGGAGVMVFLAGTARFDGSLLRLRQYLLPSPDYEGGLLGGLHADLERAGVLVSYNGKSFDLPMLEARYILAHERPSFRSLPHLDLLHPNRRLFRGRIDSHRLPTVERELLGFEREADCPSHEVPERYFRFARTGDPTHILPVLRHNAWDVLSLVALAAHLAATCEGTEGSLAAARAAEYAGDLEGAVAHFEAALASGLAKGERLEAMEHAARCARSLGRFEHAAHWWKAMLAEPRSRLLTPYVELAKLAEHHDRDRGTALRYVDGALDLVQRGLARPGLPNSETGVASLEHRRERLARTGGESPPSIVIENCESDENRKLRRLTKRRLSASLTRPDPGMVPPEA